MSDKTLHEALAEIGITSQRLPRNKNTSSRSLFDKDGKDLGSFSAKDAWEYIEQQAKG